MIDLIKYQQLLEDWQLKNFPDQSDNKFAMIVGMVEELGELAHAVLKNAQGIRDMDNEQAVKDAIADAYGDMNVYGMQLLTMCDIDVEDALTETIEHVLQRDWTKNKKDGSVEKSVPAKNPAKKAAKKSAKKTVKKSDKKSPIPKLKYPIKNSILRRIDKV